MHDTVNDVRETLSSRLRAHAPHPIPGDMLHALRRLFTPRETNYIIRVLSADELRIVADLHDSLIIARIKRMSPRRLRRFDRLAPRNVEQQRAYTSAQMEWLKGEHYLLGTRLGRSPTHAELHADFVAHRNGQRFRAYYAMKYPDRMQSPQ